MLVDRLQHQRFELKYRIAEPVALAAREFIRDRMELDRFAQNRPGKAYPVHSLYMDTDRLHLYRATLNGDRNRFKLRIRFYDDDADSPAFLEIKRRVNDCILKRRAAIRRSLLSELLRHGWPTMRHIHVPEARQLDAAQAFCRIAAELHASPRSHVAYEREAWVSRGDNALRVTFDRHVRCEPHSTAALSTTLARPAPVFPFGTVILEIKFTDRFPAWLAAMAQTLGLERSSAAKYADGVALLGEERFQNANSLPLYS